jgi:hypothetical protein
MTSSLFPRPSVSERLSHILACVLMAFTCAIAAFSALPGIASAQPGLQDGPRAGRPPADRIRTSLRLDLVTRKFELSNTDGTISNEAPFYPGARIGIELFPVAIFARESAAAGLGIQVEFGKHDVSTVTDIQTGDQEFATVDVPTRHDTTWFALVYEIAASRTVTVIPVVGWRVHEYALGYNPLFGNTFYRGVDVGAGIRYQAHPLVAVQAAFGLRPGTSLGSTAQAWGDSASAFGFGIDGGIRVRAPFGLLADAGVRYEAYSTRYEPGDSGIPATSSRDSFLSLLFSIGYAY